MHWTNERKIHPGKNYSPDLTPLDYHLWEYLNYRVYANIPQTIDARKNNIRTEIKIWR